MEVSQSVRPPREAYRYFPTGDLVVKGAGTHIQRFIFSYQVFTPFEAEKLARLKAALAGQGMRVPDHWDDTVLLRLTYGTHWKTRNAVSSVVKHLEWRRATIPQDYRILLPTVRPLLEGGCLYVHGRDCRYRPCIIMSYPKFNFREVLFTQHTIDEYMPLIGFFLDYVIANMFLPGQIENWVTVTDMGSMGLSDMPISVRLTQHIRKLIDVLQSNYRCRLAHNYVINAPTSVSMIWAVVKKFMDKDTVERISITGKGTDKAMLAQFNSEQVEQRYGGTAPNLDTFWPPIVPPGPFEAPGMATGQLLSDRSSYIPTEEISPKESLPIPEEKASVVDEVPWKAAKEEKEADDLIETEPIAQPQSSESNPSSTKSSIAENAEFVSVETEEKASRPELPVLEEQASTPLKRLVEPHGVVLDEPVSSVWGCSCRLGDSCSTSSCTAF